jgi:hypothetical protein
LRWAIRCLRRNALRSAIAASAGDLKAFERWWGEGGTEEGDATLFKVREMLLIRYYHREERLRSNTDAQGRR